MSSQNQPYRIPSGYSTPMLIYRSLRYFRRNAIDAVSMNMEKFGASTYSVVFPGRLLIIMTQDPDFINYVLRENHTNYHKSEFTSDRAARLFGKGLLFSNGAYWLQQRRLIQPGFHSKKLQDLYGIIAGTIDEFLHSFPVGNNIDVYPLMHRMSFNILIRSLFDMQLSPAIMVELNSLFVRLQDFFVKEMNRPLRKFFYPVSGLEKINLKKAVRLRSLIRDIVRQRRADPGSYNGLLDMLLAARYEDTGAPMSEEQVTDEVMILLFAGHETTANTLSWLLWLVASGEGVQERLQAVVKNIATAEACIRHEYINAVINETMRLRPAAWVTDRVALSDDGYGPFSFPKGTIIMPFFYGLHRHGDHWADGDRFRPERFIDETGKIKKPASYFPFGAGPRMCIGNNFAMAEMCLFVKAFFEQFTIAPGGEAPVMMPLMTLRPDKAMLRITKL